jgi:Holliday junction resolvasome RuvABC endonuclease subunit
MVIAGIDYSLCGPAVCLFKSNATGKFSYSGCSFYFLTDNKRQSEIRCMNVVGERLTDWDSDEHRYETIADWAVDIVMGCSHVALEGYAYSASGKVFQIAENTGILKYKLYELSIPVTIIPPTEVKKYATGKGNADKNAMYAAWSHETGVDLKTLLTPKRQECVSPVSDIVDSYYICKRLYDSLPEDVRCADD